MARITRPRARRDGTARSGELGAEGSVADARTRLARSAERAVADHLAARGFLILATNLRVGRLEIDVLARQGDLLVVVEVRTRGSGAWASAFGSIDTAKRQRVRRAGERLWQRRFRHDASVNRMRFDAASVIFTREGALVEYAEAAF